jgi:hypothetical protein
MRSLWRILALQWLGGDGSEGLAGDSTVLESIIRGEHAQLTPAFSVRRDAGVSHRAMMAPVSGNGSEPEITTDEISRSAASRHYSP